MKNLRNILILLPLILSACADSSPSFSKTFNKDFLEGKWVSLEDKKFELEFKNNKRIEFYSGQKLSEGIFKINDSSLVVIDDEVKETLKYEIIKLNKDSLSLIYLERDNTLNYIKKK
jgi:hypothetical protein